MQNELQANVTRALKNSAWDAYLIAFMFGAWGLVNIFSGASPIFGGFQLLLSLVNAMNGTERRNLAKAIEEASVESDGLS